MDLTKKVHPAISVGVILGAIFLTGFLHLMNKTAEKSQAMWYYIVPVESAQDQPR